MTKKIILASILALALTACGGDSDDTTTTDTTATDTTTTDTTACSVDDKVILGTNGSSCTYNGATFECSSTGTAILGGLSAGSGTISINGFAYTCQ